MKRYFGAVCAILVVLGCLFVSASASQMPASNSASKVELYCTVNSDGDCLVSMSVNLHLEGSDSGLLFPLPNNATDITMNGSSVSTSRLGNVIYAGVGRALNGAMGDIPVRFDFKLPKAVDVVRIGAEKRLQLTLPMLCGFDYPVEQLSFIITLPDAVTNTPTFYSTYQQTGFEANLDLVINGSMITGSSKHVLNDHESVTMTLLVPQSMFPSVSTYQREGNPELIPMGILAGLALLYWILFLRTFPPVFQRATMPPEGISAGEVNCRVTMSGGDLTMMVLSWAQMGYLLIQLKGKHVILHKLMDMGNERSLFEIRVYNALFQRGRTIDCTTAAYAKLCAKTANMIPGEKAMCRPRSGSRRIFRILLCLAQVFCGICVTLNLTSIPVLQILFCFIFGILSWGSAWLMQEFAMTIRSRYKTKIWICLAAAVFWVVIGTLGGQPWIPLGAVVVQILSSYLVAYGGMRTDLNKSEAGEILGLRRFLRHMQPEDAKRLLMADADYFFRMVPYAIAMDVAKPFARAFGRRKLEQCPYIVTNVQGKRTATEWLAILNKAVTIMDDRHQRTQRAQWLAIRFR